MSLLEPYEEDERAKKIAEHIKEIIEILGLDPESEDLRRTPIRIATTWLRFTEGYNREVKLWRQYEGKADLVAEFGIPFTTLCEHHFMPFYGTVDIGYIPKERVVGLSKLDQLVEKYALRFQIQERMTAQIADELWEAAKPYGVIVVSSAVHTCKMVEGFQPRPYVCSACRGVFLWNPAAREEFFNLRKKHYGGE